MLDHHQLLDPGLRGTGLPERNLRDQRESWKSPDMIKSLPDSQFLNLSPQKSQSLPTKFWDFSTIPNHPQDQLQDSWNPQIQWSMEPGALQKHQISSVTLIPQVQLHGYSQPQEYTRNGENWEEKLGTTHGKTTVKPSMEPPPLLAGEFSCLLPIFPSMECSGAFRDKSSSLDLGGNDAGMGFPVRAPTLLEMTRADAPGRIPFKKLGGGSRFQADFVPLFPPHPQICSWSRARATHGPPDLLTGAWISIWIWVRNEHIPKNPANPRTKPQQSPLPSRPAPGALPTSVPDVKRSGSDGWDIPGVIESRQQPTIPLKAGAEAGGLINPSANVYCRQIPIAPGFSEAPELQPDIYLRQTTTSTSIFSDERPTSPTELFNTIKGFIAAGSSPPVAGCSQTTGTSQRGAGSQLPGEKLGMKWHFGKSLPRWEGPLGLGIEGCGTEGVTRGSNSVWAWLKAAGFAPGDLEGVLIPEKHAGRILLEFPECKHSCENIPPAIQSLTIPLESNTELIPRWESTAGCSPLFWESTWIPSFIHSHTFPFFLENPLLDYPHFFHSGNLLGFPPLSALGSIPGVGVGMFSRKNPTHGRIPNMLQGCFPKCHLFLPGSSPWMVVGCFPERFQPMENVGLGRNEGIVRCFPTRIQPMGTCEVFSHPDPTMGNYEVFSHPDPTCGNCEVFFHSDPAHRELRGVFPPRSNSWELNVGCFPTRIQPMGNYEAFSHPDPTRGNGVVFSCSPGSCQHHSLLWYFHGPTSSCRPFLFGGCRGNSNRFPSRRECERRCQSSPGEAGPSKSPLPPARSEARAGEPLQDLPAPTSLRWKCQEVAGFSSLPIPRSFPGAPGHLPWVNSTDVCMDPPAVQWENLLEAQLGFHCQIQGFWDQFVWIFPSSPAHPKWGQAGIQTLLRAGRELPPCAHFFLADPKQSQDPARIGIFAFCGCGMGQSRAREFPEGAQTAANIHVVSSSFSQSRQREMSGSKRFI
ncbi:hypothetical protein DV515_00016026 [Chloebia gouldiae]|uniref:BPTI/Kunitz inhibitor domain-containing protein n=1 Tax=Chloebia gouldiae TaxID=44316 RepID=A0A3L8RV28_CHLGU|nr:hypothetical protein DV515_00016026 [Chloebia gouldiae]